MFYFLTDGSADILCGDCCITQIKCLGQLLIQFRTFVKIQLFCLDNHLCGSCHLLGLNIVVSGNFCHNRNDILFNLLDGHVIVKLYRCGSTTLELQTVCQRAFAGACIDSHISQSGYNDQNRYREPDLFLTNKIDRLSFFEGAVPFYIFHTKGIQCIHHQLGYYQCGKHGNNNTKCQSLCKSLHTSRTFDCQYRCCNQGGNVTIHNCGKGFLVTDLHSGFDGLTCCNLLTNTCKDNNIGIHRHTDGKDDTCNTRQGQGHLESIQQYQNDTYIRSQCYAGCHSHNSVNGNHEQNNQCKSDHTCN